MTLSGALKAKGSYTNYSGINELALDAMISYTYVNTSSITITYGAEWNGNTTNFTDNTDPSLSDERRLNSLYFKCYNLNNTTCDLVLAPPVGNAGSRCGTGTVTLSASGCTGTYTWYNDATTGTSIGTGNSFTTSNISNTTTYYVECNALDCTSLRSSVLATINTIPVAPTVTGGSTCGTGTVALSASGCSGGTVKWYGSETSTTLLASGASFSTGSLTNSTVYFASCTDANTCESTTRNYGIATIHSLPTAEVIAINATCLASVSRNNGMLILTKYHGNDTVAYGSPISTTPIFNSIPTGGLFASGLPNTSTTYTIRVKNINGCTIDINAQISQIMCACPAGYCEPATAQKTK